MNWYQEEDSDIATAVSLSINRYLWYLTEEFVILSLFNEKLSDFTRKFLIAIPTFPALNLSTFIYFLIGLRSGLLFDLLGLINDQEWLQMNSQEWTFFQDYRTVKSILFEIKTN